MTLNKKDLIYEAIGWYGTIAVITAYVAISFSVIESDSFWYQFLNLTGAIGIGVISIIKKAFQSVVIQVVWGIVAILAIIQMFS